jgi:hypothetical protein
VLVRIATRALAGMLVTLSRPHELGANLQAAQADLAGMVEEMHARGNPSMWRPRNTNSRKT